MTRRSDLIKIFAIVALLGSRSTISRITVYLAATIGRRELAEIDRVR